MLFAPATNYIAVAENEAINPYSELMEAIKQIESSGNQFAVGDTNLKEWSYGILQIRQSRLDDYARQTGKYYRAVEMFDTVKAKSVFMFYASLYEPWETEQITRCWNGGDKGMRKKSTKKYYLRIQKELNKN
jgi:hypothetical protein